MTDLHVDLHVENAQHHLLWCCAYFEPHLLESYKGVHNVTAPTIESQAPCPFHNLCSKACLCWYAESSAAASEEAYHSLQQRQQALQASLAEHSLHSNACRDTLNQQLQSLQSELTAVKEGRDAAVTGLKALQLCHEKSRCSLHVGLSQVNSADRHMHTHTHIQRQTHTQTHSCMQSHLCFQQTQATFACWAFVKGFDTEVHVCAQFEKT